MPLHLTIVTPESEHFSGEVDRVKLPGAQGQMEALPNHAAMVTTLEPGELSYQSGGSGEEFLAVGEGFVEINQTGVTVVTDVAAAEAEIDVNAEEQAVERARKALEESKDLSAEEEANVRASLAKSLARIDVKRRHRRN